MQNASALELLGAAPLNQVGHRGQSMPVRAQLFGHSTEEFCDPKIALPLCTEGCP